MAVEKPSEPKLNFKPLSEGLGFHPFENGLPYTPANPAKPVSNTPKPMGTGAMAAGRPSFAFPTPAAATSTAAAASASSIIAKSLPVVPERSWDYLLKRVLAFWVDSIIHMSLGFGVLVVSLWNESINADFFLNPGVLIITAGFLIFFNWALTTAEEVAFGTSIGKRLFGLSIEGSAMAILLRAFAFVPSLLLIGAGVLWAGIDPSRRGFHDIISGIQPEEI